MSHRRIMSHQCILGASALWYPSGKNIFWRLKFNQTFGEYLQTSSKSLTEILTRLNDGKRWYCLGTSTLSLFLTMHSRVCMQLWLYVHRKILPMYIYTYWECVWAMERRRRIRSRYWPFSWFDLVEIHKSDSKDVWEYSPNVWSNFKQYALVWHYALVRHYQS